MPVFLTDRGPLLFAHVPKCGGSAVEDLLVARLGRHRSALLDRSHNAADRPWSRTSPQHADAAALGRLFPKDFFAFRIATVRHPATRLRAAFLHQRDVALTIPSATDFDAWLAGLPRLRQVRPRAMDHHLRPMRQMVPKGTLTFPIEHGLAPLVAWLDAALGPADAPQPDPRRHSRAERLAELGRAAGPQVDLTPDRLDAIHQVDRGDYVRFGYGPALDAVPAPPASMAPRGP